MAFNFKSLFIETTDDDKSKSVKNDVETKVQQVNIIQDPSINTNNVEINNDILNKLCSYMESCDIPGPDYMELKKAANSEGMKIIPEIGIRFQAAFATLKSMHPHLTKKIILDSIDTYILELKKQNDIAKEQIESKRKIEIVDKNKIISEKEKQIKQLQDEVMKLTAEITKMKEDVQSSVNECDKNINEFNAAVNLLINNLTTDKNKINETLID